MSLYWLHLHWQDILGAAGGVGILVLRSWLIGKGVTIGDHLLKRVEKWLVKNELEKIAWLHYQKKAERTGHDHKSVILCDEDDCVKVR